MRDRLRLRGGRLSANDNLNTVIRPMVLARVTNTHRSDHGFVVMHAIWEGDIDE